VTGKLYAGFFAPCVLKQMLVILKQMVVILKANGGDIYPTIPRLYYMLPMLLKKNQSN